MRQAKKALRQGCCPDLMSRMDRASIIKIYVGTRYFGSSHPVLLVTGDNTQSNVVFGEHYLFHSYQGIPFIYRRDFCSAQTGPDAISFDDFPEVFFAEAMVANQLIAARAQFEYTVSEQSRELQFDLFWSERPMEFRETGDSCFIRFKASRQFVADRQAMFGITRSKAVKEFEGKLSRVPEITWRHEPNA